MAISTTDTEFLKYYTLLDDLQKKSLLDVMKSFIDLEGVLNKPGIEQYNKELDEAMERVSLGEFTGIDQLEKEMHTW